MVLHDFFVIHTLSSLYILQLFYDKYQMRKNVVVIFFSHYCLCMSNSGEDTSIHAILWKDCTRLRITFKINCNTKLTWLEVKQLSKVKQKKHLGNLFNLNVMSMENKFISAKMLIMSNFLCRIRFWDCVFHLRVTLSET